MCPLGVLSYLVRGKRAYRKTHLPSGGLQGAYSLLSPRTATMLPRGRRLLQEVAARAGAASGAPWTGESRPRARSAGETLTHTWHSLTVVDTHLPRTRLSLTLIVGLSYNVRGQVDTYAKGLEVA